MPGDREQLQAELRDLYAQIAALTKPRCGQCWIPWECCHPTICELIENFAKHDGIELPPRTDHPRLPYLGSEGCILEPYQRPLCAIHVCEKHLWELPFRIQYYDLCARIAAKESEINGS